jgi:hypothetical protein
MVPTVVSCIAKEPSKYSERSTLTRELRVIGWGRVFTAAKCSVLMRIVAVSVFVASVAIPL